MPQNILNAEPVECPLCGNTFNETVSVVFVPGYDDYKAGWEGRGNLTFVVIQCGHCQRKWDLCLGFHKGELYMFKRAHQDGEHE